MVTRISLLLVLVFNLPIPAPHVHVSPPERAQLAAFDAQNIRFVEVASGLNQPLFITNAGDGSGRLFIIQRTGQILIYKNGSVLSTPFLNIQSIVNSSGGEEGLLALAFHPGYETNGQFYTVFTDSNGSLILSRFTRSSTNPDLADPNSRTTLLTISHPTYQNHNGGTLAFGPDGYLYWSTGDGGSGGDPSNNAQNLGSLLGKILRLDVDSGSPYTIPASNPFYNNPNPSIRKEIWAYGLRNPWRISFDRQTGDLYIGDVGQNNREEIDFQSAGSSGGENYGWRVMEGSTCYNPSTGCDRSGKVLPVAEYDHTKGCSITGGHIYRGTMYPQMNGYYFYGDFCSGLVYTLHGNPVNGWTTILIADTAYSISSFGEDEAGELYVADYTTGKIYHIAYLPVPAKATLVSPSGDITDTQPNFIWDAVLDSGQGDAATWYYLWVDGPSGNVIKQWYQAANVCNGATCSTPSPITLSGGPYTWWIQTWNPGGLGPWSDGMNFSLPVPRPPVAATLAAPSGSVTNNQPSYTWNAVLDGSQGDAATWYYLWINGPSGKIFAQWYQALDVCSGSTCSIDPGVTLGSGNYTWWIQPWNPGGSGPWSSAMTFSIPALGAATLISPTGPLGANYNPAYTWNEVASATWYYLWVNGPSGNVIKQWYTSAQANCNGSTCSVIPTTTLAGGSYTWWIQPWNPAGLGPWSAAMSFTVAPLAAATLISPEGSIASHTPAYTWNEVPGATWYYLWVNGPSGVVIQQWYTSAQANCSGATCSVVSTTTLGSGSHTWWIQTWNSAGLGPWSSAKSFTVTP